MFGKGTHHRQARAGINEAAKVNPERHAADGGQPDHQRRAQDEVARQNAAPGAVAALNAIGKRATLEGKQATTLPLRFSDGQVLLGPIPVGRVPPLF